MAEPCPWETVTAEEIHQVAAQYSEHVPYKAKELDRDRYETIPQLLAKRKELSDAHLSKSELVKLIEWKLAHGTFRPNLLKLARSNAVDTVEAVTRQAYSSYLAAENQDSAAKGPLAKLTTLSGVGPAASSMLLSVLDGQKIPFFSDELYRFVHLEKAANGRASGWERNIKYTVKEYKSLLDRVHGLQARLGKDEQENEAISAIELERYAYTLARLQETQNDPSPAEQEAGTSKTDSSTKRSRQQEAIELPAKRPRSTRSTSKRT